MKKLVLLMLASFLIISCNQTTKTDVHQGMNKGIGMTCDSCKDGVFLFCAVFSGRIVNTQFYSYLKINFLNFGCPNLQNLCLSGRNPTKAALQVFK